MRILRITFLSYLVIAATAAYPLIALAQTAGQPVRAEHGMVASAHQLASEVGAQILKDGGNAVDAAVAVALALAVVYPEAGNLGGGGFMLIRMADSRTVAIDYRESAPAAATRDMYVDANGALISNASLVGYKASGIPGTVAGLSLALDKYGSMKWADVVKPAQKLAADGFIVSGRLARGLRNDKNLASFPESKRIFQRDGDYYKEGERIRQPELAATLKRLEEKGPREFYEGETAQILAADMKANGGLITLEDLKRYKPAMRTPIKGTYRGYDIITMPPPSSGGIALLQMLNMLESYDLSRMGFGSTEYSHLLIETMRRAFADRAEFPGDPDFVKVPVSGLTSKQYAKTVAATIDLKTATPSEKIKAGNPTTYESTQTTHFSVVDAKGNAVSNTYTLNMTFGSGVTIGKAGFLMNNEMDDFTSKPGTPNGFGLIQGEANSIAPGKRPLSSMTPTIVLKDGKLFMVVGSPGGPTIINSVLQVILNVIDHKMNIKQAVEAPRLHHQWMPDICNYERMGFTKEVVEALERMGHKLQRRSGSQGDVESIAIDPVTGNRLGASDPRSPDSKAVGH